MKLVSIYALLSVVVSIGVGIWHQPTITPSGVTTENLPFNPAYNVAISTKSVVAAYPQSGVDFTLKYHPGVLYVGTETGLQIMDAEVFQVSPTAWTADCGDGQYVTVDAASGETWAYLDGEFRCYTKETSKP